MRERRRGRAVRADNAVTAFTAGLSILVLPFLIIASCLLYVAPANTEQHFAWTIEPGVTAMYLASAYLGGVWFFGNVLRVRQWHRVRHGFPAVLVFAGLLAAATALHWDRFHAGHVSFLAWTALYITTPFLVGAALVLQAGSDPGKPAQRDTVIPAGWRIALAVLGLLSMGVGVVLFLVPTLGLDTWAWPLTPLTARVLGATLTLPGMVNVWLLIDVRWSAFRILFQAQMVSLGFILVALALSWSQLDFSRVAAWLLPPGLLVTLLLYALVYGVCEMRMRRHLPGTEPPVNPRAV
ncbi:hypothetical protein [Mycetocola zhadangensis]|uniref:hypothetical protein n=1 Tax=Mycetocola zhadangensis TaxID=1164595 RepID=UPI00160049CD|nr:hypothetical protein [Mycetocola zhadangensis]GGE90261.1 hypothetical protein GCM10011313_11450 [Mycetocola zhadangensis]